MKSFFNSEFNRIKSKYSARIFKPKDFEKTKLGLLDVGDRFVFISDKYQRKTLYRVTGKTFRAMYILQMGDNVESSMPAPFNVGVIKVPGNWKKITTSRTKGVQSKYSNRGYKKPLRRYDNREDYEY